MSNDVDGSSDSGGARNELGRSGAEALGGEGAFGVAGEGGTRERGTRGWTVASRFKAWNRLKNIGGGSSGQS